MEREQALRRYYRALRAAWGPQNWWPARTQFEVIAGAFLTQNTAWSNVERALQAMRRAGVLSVAGVRRTPRPRLERLIRSAGYFRQKAQRLKNFVRHVDERYGGSLARMFARPTAALRAELLALDGIGPETADSILLYAGGHASFVVDAYTHRILERHRIIGKKWRYEQIRELFQRAMVQDQVTSPQGLRPESVVDLNGPTKVGLLRRPRGTLSGNSKLEARNSRLRPRKYEAPNASATAQVYNEYHALLVRVGKHHCKKKRAECLGCPLEPFLPPRRGSAAPGRGI
ncbi:MAG TPA: hypothetical protein VNK82_05260 [Terriglobales bacterium]|nr:hypothetical protein [Terriglobales bacterium]